MSWVVSADHIDLGHCFVNSAHAFPVLRKENRGIGSDLDDLAAFVHIGAASREKMAELVACYMADPLAWRAAPDAALRATFRAFVQQLAGGTGLAFEHDGNDAPVDEVGMGQWVVQLWRDHQLRSFAVGRLLRG